jgi:glycosyltransferase involved in cell wall biosynthesis
MNDLVLKKKNIVTIVTAVFNGASTIEETILSVLQQTYKGIEYIIIDAASKDDTLNIIKKNEPQFEGRLKWISEPDKGIYDAWNKGVNLATGEWIAFVGSDDILMLDAIENYVMALNENPKANYISSQVLLVKENLDFFKQKGDVWSDNMKKYCCIAHVGSLHHKTLFEKKGLFDTSYKSAGDYDFLLRCYDIIYPLYINKVTAKVRIGGISQRLNYAIAKETLRTKISNLNRSILLCYLDHYLAVFKSYVRFIYFKMIL